MTLPRQILPGEFYMLTRRCTQRMFLLRPDPETNNAFIYCLAEAARRFDIEVILPLAMSNHHHTVLFDRNGNISAFMEHFHRNVAKCQNALRGRWENHWSSEPPSIVRLAGVHAVIDKVVYAATNPVKDDLVDRVDHWPGVNGWIALRTQRPLRARRPPHYFRPDGDMPAQVELELAVPPELGEREPFIAVIRARITEVEHQCALRRNRTGKRVLGRRNVLRQRCTDTPRTLSHVASYSPRWQRGASGGASKRCSAVTTFSAHIGMHVRHGWLEHRFRFPRGRTGSGGSPAFPSKR